MVTVGHDCRTSAVASALQRTEWDKERTICRIAIAVLRWWRVASIARPFARLGARLESRICEDDEMSAQDARYARGGLTARLVSRGILVGSVRCFDDFRGVVS